MSLPSRNTFSILAISIGMSITVSSCGTPGSGGTKFQPVPGNPEVCLIYVPYRASDLSGLVEGSATLGTSPGAKGNITGKTKWGYATYVGKCGDPSTWRQIANPDSAASPAPAPSANAKAEKSAAADPKSESLAVKSQRLAQAVVVAGDKPSVASILPAIAAFYDGLNKYADLRPAKGNTVSAETLIAALKRSSASVSKASAKTPNSAEMPIRFPQNSKDPRILSTEADKLLRRLR